MAEQKQWLTTHQVADLLKCSTSKVQNLAKRGDLVAARMGTGKKAPMIFELVAVEAYRERMPTLIGWKKPDVADRTTDPEATDTLRQILAEQQKTNALLQQQLDAWR